MASIPSTRASSTPGANRTGGLTYRLVSTFRGEVGSSVPGITGPQHVRAQPGRGHLGRLDPGRQRGSSWHVVPPLRLAAHPGQEPDAARVVGHVGWRVRPPLRAVDQARVRPGRSRRRTRRISARERIRMSLGDAAVVHLLGRLGHGRACSRWWRGPSPGSCPGRARRAAPATMPAGSSASVMKCSTATSSSPTGWLKSISRRRRRAPGSAPGRAGRPRRSRRSGWPARMALLCAMATGSMSA